MDTEFQPDLVGKPAKLSWRAVWRNSGRVVVAITVVLFWIVIPVTLYVGWSIMNDMEEAVSEGDYAEEEPACNVYGLNIHGDIVTYASAGSGPDETGPAVETASEYIIFSLQQAQEDDTIKAVILDIDSYGGSPLGGKEMADAIKNFTKPAVALIRQAGASSAYWAASGADVIFASPLSDVGGIGVTMSYLESAGWNAKEGFVYQQLSTGKYKDTGSPDKPLTPEEKALIMRDLNTIHEQFIQDVAENRKLSMEEVRKLADGATVLGQAALQSKLIDRLGSYQEVEQYLKELLKEDVEYCW